MKAALGQPWDRPLRKQCIEGKAFMTKHSHVEEALDVQQIRIWPQW